MKERVSALLDDALDEEASSRLFESIKRDAGLRRDWESYCLIGDVLREDTPLSTDFTSKVMASLSDEVTVLAPVRRRAPAGPAS
jgi:sigma-E factor negative regulatory protein RseA